MRLALFQPDIPQNLGAALRLAACMGVPLDVIEPCGFPLSDAAIHRAAMDYSGLAQVKRHAGWSDFRADSGASGRLVLFTTRAATPVHDFAFSAEDVLLFGRESAGRRYAVALPQRLPSRIVHCMRPKPSCCAPL